MRSPNRLLGAVLGAAHLVVGVAGFFVPGSTRFFDRHVSLNGGDNALHFASAAVLLAAGLGGDRDVRTPVTG